MKRNAGKNWRGHWIWHPESDPHGYNESVCFRKHFVCEGAVDGLLKITADSRYRVSLNGVWINDGPGRAYPEHFTYDVYDIGNLLRKGRNRIEVIVRYFGVGTFHQLPQRGGLLAQIECAGGVIGTDASWQASTFPALAKWTPKVSAQMEPVEEYDARLDGKKRWLPATVVCAPESGPWKKLQPRRSPPMTKQICRPVRFCDAVKVKRESGRVCVPVTRIAHPAIVETNMYTSRPVILASELVVKKKTVFDFSTPFWKVAVGGTLLKNGKTILSPGRHVVAFFFNDFYGHIKERGFPFVEIPGGRWQHPWAKSARHPWVVAVLDDCLFRDNDRIWPWFPSSEADEVKARYESAIVRLAATCAESEHFRVAIWKSVRTVPARQLFMEDFSADFEARKPMGSALRQLGSPEADDGRQVVSPVKNRDIELCYDMGCQRCGYFDFEITATAGTVVDLHLVEDITPEGIIQHTAEINRNGLRYITSEGRNRFISLKRRSGRFLFLTLRNQKSPVEIRFLRMIESTADVQYPEPFRCSDETLNRVWEISERTLKLCMEDVFTDCPLYEQTLWIGDARNEAIYAFHTYGDRALSARSLELGAQSLAHFPMVGCQVPSGWDCLLPAWSFLWGIHVWEHYFHTGDLSFLKQLWPAVKQNIHGAFRFIDNHGLFSGTLWNLLEWAPIDQEHPTVMHNSMLLAGALLAAEKCSKMIGDEPALHWLRSCRKKLTAAINVWWDPVKKSYPDAILENGTASSKTCQHNSALGVLFDVLPEAWRAAARKNLLDPPEGMTRINSPFAAQFHFEALEKLDEIEAIMASIRQNYTPMIKAGATTVWETFPNSTCSPEGFPTRSHCHGWSCGPLQFFSRIVLGIRQTMCGGMAFEISPWVSGLDNASGAMPTPQGPLHVEWNLERRILRIVIRAPDGVKIRHRPNDSQRGLAVKIELKRG